MEPSVAWSAHLRRRRELRLARVAASAGVAAAWGRCRPSVCPGRCQGQPRAPRDDGACAGHLNSVRVRLCVFREKKRGRREAALTEFGREGT